MSKLNTRYKAYIFDLGGVLFRWKLEEAAIRYFKREELPTALYFLNHVWWHLDAGFITKERLQDYLFGIGCYGNYINRIKRIAENFVHELKPIERNIEIMEQVIDLNTNVFILSNFQSSSYYVLEKKYRVLKRVKDKIISSEENMLKPDENIFLLAEKKFQVIPKNTLFIDDTQANIQTAKNLGFKTYHYNNKRSILNLKHII